MNKPRMILTLVLSVVLLTVLGPPSVSQAATSPTYLQLTGLWAATCTPGSVSNIVSVDLAIASGDTSTFYWTLENLRTGAREAVTLGPFPGPVFFPNGLTSLPTPAGTQPGDILEYTVIASSELYSGTVTRLRFNCSTGAVLFMTFDDFIYQAAPVPEGFVLHAITCDTAVYDAPDGQVVGDNRISAGQTWYVNPTPVTGPDGRSWSEIFLAGPSNAYIPGACVGEGVSGD